MMKHTQEFSPTLSMYSSGETEGPQYWSRMIYHTLCWSDDTHEEGKTQALVQSRLASEEVLGQKLKR